MQRWTIMIAVGAAVVGGALGAGLAAGPMAGRAPALLPAAFAGGLVQESPGRLWTASPDGDAVYEWVVGGGNGSVVRYDWNTGQAQMRRLASPLRAADAGEAAPVDPDDAKELRVTGVIWTPNAETRTAIINGQIVREGELVTGKSGKIYKVIQIHQDREVKFEEVKPEDGGK